MLGARLVKPSQLLLLSCWLWKVFEGTMVGERWLQTAPIAMERTRGRGTTDSSTVQLQLAVIRQGFLLSALTVQWFSLQSWGVFRGP